MRDACRPTREAARWCVFDSWNQWTWVTVAWLQLPLAFGAYLAYLAWRGRRAGREEDES